MEEEAKQIQYLQTLLKDSSDAAFPHFERKQLIQEMYDGEIAPGEFGTMSELFDPVLRTAVKKAIPDAMAYAFPADGLTSLRPTKEGVTFDQVRQFEDALDHTMLNVMKVKRKSIPIFQDAVKYGCGYGIVETESVTVAESGIFSVVEDNGEVSEKRRDLKISPMKKLIPSLRYLPYECVIPSPDGTSVDECSCVMVIDYYREDKFLSLYESQAASKTKIYLGDAKEHIESCVEQKIDGIYPHWYNIKVMSGAVTDTQHNRYAKMHDIANRNRGDEYAQRNIMIPVVKYFFDREQIWLVNGDTIMFRDKDTYQTMRKPVLKASLDFDSNNWWALSDVAASRDMAYGINAYSNAMLDMIGQYLRPMMAYDKSRWGGEEAPRYEPWGTIAVNGNIQGAVQTIAPAQLPGGLTQFGDKLSADYSSANMEPLGGQASPGLVRGGNNAFEGLLQTQNAPREFAGMLLDMGFIEPLIQNVMVQMQTLPQEDFEYIELADKEYVARRISLNDIRYDFEVSTDMVEKLRASANDTMVDINMYQQVYRNNPWIKEQEALAIVIGNKEKTRKLMRTEAEYKEYVESMQQQSEATQAQSPEMQGQQPQ